MRKYICLGAGLLPLPVGLFLFIMQLEATSSTPFFVASLIFYALWGILGLWAAGGGDRESLKEVVVFAHLPALLMLLFALGGLFASGAMPLMPELYFMPGLNLAYYLRPGDPLMAFTLVFILMAGVFCLGCKLRGMRKGAGEL